MTLEQMRTAREMRMLKQSRSTYGKQPSTYGSMTVTSLQVKVAGVWTPVFVPGIDDPDDTGLYIY
jgi:hypothetical protein